MPNGQWLNRPFALLWNDFANVARLLAHATFIVVGAIIPVSANAALRVAKASRAGIVRPAAGIIAVGATIV